MLFQLRITPSSADFVEVDFNLHKTNSSYFADTDIARAHLMSTLFDPAIEHMRGGSGAYTGAGALLFGLALGAVSCSFRREIHPAARPASSATALSRCVFKLGRKTVSPGDMLRMAGLVPENDAVSSGESDKEIDSELRDVEEQRQCGIKLASMLDKEDHIALEAEFHGAEGQVLRRHTDGTGVADVVITLLQLAGLKRKWYL
ncbi:putative capsule polysaccharide biosynthesis protein [Colletotrichum sublineola]|uniref:Putative capsule polysaccharide biosynthesis protein n=1 Tax=Colletotrichum sublineola TaxID=1173701 RepID=A0A066XAC5_COLSU|nr:putative capsule polysaccharide biosynthesis protein [Colletotrichum sublineola]